MSTKHLQLKPHKIRGISNAWWYEEPKGICIVVEPAGNETRSITIRWTAVRESLKRKDRP